MESPVSEHRATPNDSPSTLRNASARRPAPARRRSYSRSRSRSFVRSPSGSPMSPGPRRRPVQGRSFSPDRRSYSPQGRSFSPGRGRGPSPFGRRHPGHVPPSAPTIFVGGLPPDTQVPDVKAFFERYGNVSNVKLIYDRETSAFKGFGFVTFWEHEDAETAVEEASGSQVLGHRIRCDHARDNRSMRNGPRDRRRFSPPPDARPRWGRGRDSAPRAPHSRSPQTGRGSPWRDRGFGDRSDSPPRGAAGSRSPPLKRGRKASPDEPASPPSGATHAAKLQQEVTVLRRENRDLLESSSAAEGTAKELTKVIEAAKRKVDRQQSKLKTTTFRSQKRGQFMVSLVEAANQVHACQAAVKGAQEALEGAQAHLADVVAQADAYAVAETAERDAEDAARRKRVSASAVPPTSDPGEVAATTEAAAPEDQAWSPPDVRGGEDRENGGGPPLSFGKMKPFKFSLSDAGAAP